MNFLLLGLLAISGLANSVRANDTSGEIAKSLSETDNLVKNGNFPAMGAQMVDYINTNDSIPFTVHLHTCLTNINTLISGQTLLPL
jgi:hypothetical protein